MKKFDKSAPAIWEINNSYTLNELVSVAQTFGYPVERSNILYVEKRLHFSNVDGLAIVLKPNEIAVCRQLLTGASPETVLNFTLGVWSKNQKFQIYTTTQFTNCFLFTYLEGDDFMIEYDVYKFDNLPSAVA